MTPAIKSPAATWLGTEMFEDEFGTVLHLMDITGPPGDPFVDGLLECESNWKSGMGRG